MATPLSSGAPLPSPLLPKPKWRVSKEVHFNHDLSVTKKLQAGVDLVADLVGVTLGPKGRNVLLQNPYGPPKIVNDGETVLKEVQLADPLANVGVKLVRQAGSKTNQLAGDGCTTAIVLARGLISEGVKVVATGINPVLLARGLDKIARALVSELRLMSREIRDHEIARVAAIASGNDREVGDMIADALRRVGGFGAVRIDKGRGIGNTLQILEGMQFDRGYLSPYFVTDRRNMVVEFENCKLLLVDGKITNAKDLVRVLDSAVRENYPLLIVAENVEQDALAPVIRNKLKGALRAAAVKAPAFGERKSQCLDDIAVLTRATVIRDAMGYSLEKAGSEVLGSAAKVVVTKDSTLIVTDGRTREDVEKRVAQLRSLVENTDESFNKKLLIERIARLSTGIAVIQVGAQTEVELKDRKLRIEDALNAARAAIEEGVVVGGGCCMLRLSMKVDDIKRSLLNEEEKIGAEIFKKALAYPAKLIAENAGKNGSVVVEKILSSSDSSFGYNASKDCYEDLVSSGILDPTKVLRCCLEHASSVARTFLLSDVVVVDSEVSRPIPTRRRTRPDTTLPMLDRSQTMSGRFSGLGKSKLRF